jgi:6-phosphogluconate dehydrogenase
MTTAKIGMVGLGVMGKNLAASRGERGRVVKEVQYTLVW